MFFFRYWIVHKADRNEREKRKFPVLRRIEPEQLSR
jgi:hypothetical protein